MLRSRRSRREQSIATMRMHLSRSRAACASDPEQEALLADSVELVLLVVLDSRRCRWETRFYRYEHHAHRQAHCRAVRLDHGRMLNAETARSTPDGGGRWTSLIPIELTPEIKRPASGNSSCLRSPRPSRPSTAPTN